MAYLPVLSFLAASCSHGRSFGVGGGREGGQIGFSVVILQSPLVRRSLSGHLASAAERVGTRTGLRCFKPQANHMD